MWNQNTNRPWAALLLVGALILTALVMLQGIVTAAPPPAPQGVEPTRDDGLRLWSRMGGGRIGLSVVDLNSPEMRGSLTEGAVVRSVTPEGPADGAGLENGDVIVEFDGERVRGARQLSRLVQETPVGRDVPVLVARDDERVSLRVTPKEGPDLSAAVREWMPDLGRLEQRLRQALPRGRQRLGIVVTDVGPQLAAYFGVEHGVLVTTVIAESVAADAGLEAGDVLTEIDGAPVDDVETLHRRVAAITLPATVQIEVSRDGEMITLEARFEEIPESNRRASRHI
jgi:serine protease Do